jgi:serine/threonine-protein kinase HipA
MAGKSRAILSGASPTGWSRPVSHAGRHAHVRRQEGGPFLREEGVKRIPPLIEFPKLLSAAEHVMEEKDTEEELRMLFAPGSSPGGARPKASVRDKDGHLAIAKFPRKDDEINTVA